MIGIENSSDRVLKYLYEKGTIDNLGINIFDVAKELGITEDPIDIGESLTSHGLAEFTANGGMIKITYQGLDHVEAVLSDEEEVQGTGKKRERFLKKLYERHMSGNKYMQIQELNRELGFDDSLTRSMIRYYRNKTYVKQTGFGGPISITYNGINEVERNLGG